MTYLKLGQRLTSTVLLFDNDDGFQNWIDNIKETVHVVVVCVKNVTNVHVVVNAEVVVNVAIVVKN